MTNPFEQFLERAELNNLVDSDTVYLMTRNKDGSMMSMAMTLKDLRVVTTKKVNTDYLFNRSVIPEFTSERWDSHDVGEHKEYVAYVRSTLDVIMQLHDEDVVKIDGQAYRVERIVTDFFEKDLFYIHIKGHRRL